MAKTQIHFSGKVKPFRTKFGEAIPSPRSFSPKYRAFMNTIIKAMVDVGEDIFAAVQNGESQAVVDRAISQAFDQVNADFEESSDSEASRFVGALDEHVRRKTNTMIKKVLGVQRVNIDFAPSKAISDRLNFMVARNVSLIRRLESAYFSRLQRLTTANFTGNLDPSQGTLAEQIQSLGGLSRRHSTLIAIDQTNKITGNMVQMRQEQLGIISYRWRNSEDSRVVGNPSGLYPKATKLHGNHWLREGKVFYYRRPPFDGNPGQPIRCRCHAEPIIRVDDLNLAT